MLHWLRCGSLAFALDLSTGWLWHLTMDGVEVFQSLYPAVRDRNWATIPTRVTAWSVTGRDYEVIVTLSGVCGNEEIALDWTGQVTASQAGLLQYAFEARARKDFWKNRIGLCIHIPATYTGAPARGIARDGTVTDGALPVSIAPHQPFRNLAQFTFTLPDKRHCTIIFESDIFEMEDQRNWSDASFKIYSTPLDLPFPVLVHEGQVLFQRVTALIEPKETAPAEAELISLDCDPTPLTPVPFGTQLPPLTTADEMDRLTHCLALLQPDHLRLDVHAASVQAGYLRAAAHLAKRTATPLLIALYATDPAQVQEVVPLLTALDAPLKALVLHHPAEKVTPPALLAALGDELHRIGPLPLAAGTDFFFAELNRDPHPWPQADWIVFTMTPGVHALDDRSLLLNATIQGQVVESARAVAGGRPILVSPITLRMRRNPNATTGGWDIRREEQVDRRLHAVFGAAWLLQSLASLATAQPVAVTYFELAGSLGIFAEHGSAPGDRQNSEETLSFTPLARVMHRLLRTARNGARWFRARSTNPVQIQTLGILLQERWELLIANPWPSPQVVEITHLPGTIEGIDALHPLASPSMPALSQAVPLLALPPNAVVVLWGRR